MICGCGKELARRNKSGRCAACAAADPATRAKKGQLSDEQRAIRSARMRAINADRDIVARRSVKIAALHADPVFKARHAKAVRNGKREAMRDPKYRAELVEAGRRVQALCGPDARAKASASMRRRRLGWCPEPLWPLNALLKRKGLLLNERKAAILADVPGTVEHARRSIANVTDAQRIREERERLQAY